MSTINLPKEDGFELQVKHTTDAAVLFKLIDADLAERIDGAFSHDFWCPKSILDIGDDIYCVTECGGLVQDVTFPLWWLEQQDWWHEYLEYLA